MFLKTTCQIIFGYVNLKTLHSQIGNSNLEIKKNKLVLRRTSLSNNYLNKLYLKSIGSFVNLSTQLL